MINIRGTFINPDHISMARVNTSKDGKEFSLVVDFSYSKPDGPVFLSFTYSDKEEAAAALSLVVGETVDQDSL